MTGKPCEPEEIVAAQCRFVGSQPTGWSPCSIEHAKYVLGVPHEWPGYEVRLLRLATALSAPPPSGRVMAQSASLSASQGMSQGTSQGADQGAAAGLSPTADLPAAVLALTQAIQRLHSLPYNLTKAECVQVVKDLRAQLLNAAGAACTAPAPRPVAARFTAVAEGLPAYDESERIVCFTEGHDYGGTSLITLKASDFYDVDPDALDDTRAGTREAQTVSHWVTEGDLIAAILEAHPLRDLVPSREDLIAALSYYAEGEHFYRAAPDQWETVSGEPQNLWCDKGGTATVEDGTVASLVLAGALTAAQLAARLTDESN